MPTSMSFGSSVDVLELHELRDRNRRSRPRLDVDRYRVAGLLEVERFLELRQHARVPAVKVRDRFARGLEQHAVGVEELERQRDDGVGENLHGISGRRKGGTRDVDAEAVRAR
jgi:hypothetical protein